MCLCVAAGVGVGGRCGEGTTDVGCTPPLPAHQHASCGLAHPTPGPCRLTRVQVELALHVLELLRQVLQQLLLRLLLSKVGDLLAQVAHDEEVDLGGPAAQAVQAVQGCGLARGPGKPALETQSLNPSPAQPPPLPHPPPAHTACLPARPPARTPAHLTRLTNSLMRLSQERAGMSYRSCSRSSCSFSNRARPVGLTSSRMGWLALKLRGGAVAGTGAVAWRGGVVVVWCGAVGARW